MLKIFGNRWTNELTTDQRHKAVNSWATLDDREARIAKAKFQWGLDETVDIWADEKPPKDYCKFSLAALLELNAGMERGIHWTTTAAELRSRLAPKEPMKFVPPVKKALPAITNPAVLRALTELRKVVNAIVRQYDYPPYEIRIELARELRKTANNATMLMKPTRRITNEGWQPLERFLMNAITMNIAPPLRRI